ncbi:MAG TPA: DUF460 domain-containing protein [Methanobacteriaceae archaeon]|nr:DUF460 domain-containing protein [Methanobacteriaceae archaeon]
MPKGDISLLYPNTNGFKVQKAPKDKNPENSRGIIVGFDPGLTVGLAILDLDGNVLSVGSFKETSRSDIVSYIMGYGKTILISTDVYPHPKMVKKLSSTLKSRIDAPNKFISVESKIETVETYLKSKSHSPLSKVVPSDEIPQNAHERDALAAALKTYKKYQNKLQHIFKRAKELDLSDFEVDKIRIMFLQGIPVSKAIEEVLESKMPVEDDFEFFLAESQDVVGNSDLSKEYMELVSPLKKKIKSQENQIKNLKKKNRALVDDLSQNQLEISKLNQKVDDLHYQYSKGLMEKKEINSKIVLIKGLQEKYQNEKRLRMDLEENLTAIKNIQSMEISKDVVPVKIIEFFTREGLKEACEYWKIKKGDVVFLKNSKGGGSHTASLIIQRKIKAVILNDKISHPAVEEFEKNMIPLLDVDSVDLRMIDRFAVVGAYSLQKQIEEWENHVKNKRDSEDRKKLLNVIDEYRAKRRRS